MRVGILGGAFNPPHIGHLVCAQEALVQLPLDTVMFMPVGEAPHREIEQDPGPEVRARMCELAIEGDDRFELSRLEIEREGTSWSIDTVRGLHERAPDDELFWIMGSDQAASLPKWREPEALLELAAIAVAERVLARRPEVTVHLARLRGADKRVRFFDMPRVDVSASLVRRRVAAGKPIRYLVPEPVARYIDEHELYRAGKAVASS